MLKIFSFPLYSFGFLLSVSFRTRGTTLMQFCRRCNRLVTAKLNVARLVDKGNDKYSNLCSTFAFPFSLSVENVSLAFPLTFSASSSLFVMVIR